MKFVRKGISTAAIGAIAVVAIIVVGAGAYLAASGSKATTTVTQTGTNMTSTVTSTATTSSVVTSLTTISGSVSTVTSTSTGTVTSTATTTSVSTTTASSAHGAAATLNGAGSTLVFPVMSSWTFAYQQYTGNVNVNYQSVGSGAGVTDLTQKTVDYGASDAPPSAAQYSAFPAGVVVIPETASAVVPAYNLPGLTGTGIATNGNGLKFTGAVLAQIFLGTITMWNDPAIQALNPGVTIPAHAITVIHRSDSSGTMFAFTNYLSDSSSAWKSGPGTASLPNWPTGIGCKGNEGVAGCIQNTQYSIGPLEIAYTIINSGLISYGSVANASGNYVLANVTNVAAAVQAGASTQTLPAGNGVWSSVSIINNIYNDTTDTSVYPITTFSYMVVYQAQASQAQGEALVQFLWWVVNSAQGTLVPPTGAATLGYIPLPANVVASDDVTIKSITYNGTPLFTGPVP